MFLVAKAAVPVACATDKQDREIPKCIPAVLQDMKDRKIRETADQENTQRQVNRNVCSDLHEYMEARMYNQYYGKVSSITHALYNVGATLCQQFFGPSA